ncbi:hypothetical protein DL95DRAFT_388982 [Leptodontidium sp. 2 PMI_412]|nr:hypothetical protein DL95DRAFT_388982 [Leptodontidium sp. 2 PMI_412]
MHLRQCSFQSQHSSNHLFYLPQISSSCCCRCCCSCWLAESKVRVVLVGCRG